MSSFKKVIRNFPKVFWVSNFMELFERWAWYGFYMAFALYLTLSKDSGALGFSQAQKGAMITGILILSVGLLFMFTGQNPWIAIFGILIFAVGEMASSPKFTEYIGRIAPADKKALYMGTSFLPIAAGHWMAGILSGDLYARKAEKLTLLQKELATRGLELPEITESFTRTDFMNKAGELMGMNQNELTNYLFNQYHPDRIWILYSGLAVGTALCLFLYDRFILKSSSENSSTTYNS